MTAIGASLQLLPVATQAARRQRALAGRDLVAVHAGRGADRARDGRRRNDDARRGRRRRGGGARRVRSCCWRAISSAAKGMPVVVAHGWAALASLIVVIATALSLAGTYVGMPTIDRATAIALHVVFAAYGFMGMLALGLSYIVVPMFALSAAPAERPAWASFALAMLALAARRRRGTGRRPRAAPHRMAIAAGLAAVGRASAADGHRAHDRDAPPSRPLVHARADRVGGTRGEPCRRAGRGPRRSGRRHGDAVRARPDRRLAAHFRCSRSCSGSCHSWRRCTRPRRRRVAGACRRRLRR